MCKMPKVQPAPPKTQKHSCTAGGSRRPLCSDHEWSDRCPSGCRMRGLIDDAQRIFQERLKRVCARMGEDRHEISKSMIVTKQLYADQRKPIVRHYVAEMEYLELFAQLRSNLTSLRRRAVELAERLRAQYGLVQRQVTEARKAEVDVDIKIRSCHGSCGGAIMYHANVESYQSLDRELSLFDRTSIQEKRPSRTLARRQMKSRSKNPAFTSYGNLPLERQEFINQFEDIEQYQLALEHVLEDHD
ncbi:fibrinogen alpha chain isoform X2 [Brienomyrus brachyistius]|uniref:fibrinogen alpha chain isoform X2 n=1 Tax=Brienomyrus brachyistius TaxID=42636 RepID=UPI0020B2AFA8|nr:fibrinogen alpha chain isoform X2 [Brienomyrus brachyistius]